MGRFQNGQVVGHFWIGIVNNGFIHGIADVHGQATGDDFVYIYPDGVTALKGQFEKTYMRKARNVNVVKYGCDADTGMFIPVEFTQPLSEHVFKYDPPTNVSYGQDDTSWQVPDPYEVKNVKVGHSQVPNSGEGVFLIKDIPVERVACYYTMFLYRSPDEVKLFNASCTYNYSRTDDERRECNKYSLQFQTYDAIISLPPEHDHEPYPNAGPKVNHHFRLNNTQYVESEHPRWGYTQSVTPLVRSLKAGEELFTQYGYTSNKFPYDYEWYWETKRLIERDERLKKEEEEYQKWKEEKAKKSKKSMQKKSKKQPNQEKKNIADS